MQQKEKILKAIKIIGLKLQDHSVKWIIGGSGSLLVHGLDVTPNDIDLITNDESYHKVKSLLLDFIEKDTNTEDLPFTIGDVSGHILVKNIDESLLTKIDIDGVEIFVYSLEAEYGFYKSRTDKIEANKLKISLIEKALSRT